MHSFDLPSLKIAEMFMQDHQAMKGNEKVTGFKCLMDRFVRLMLPKQREAM